MINFLNKILDDLILLKYKESLEESSSNINLFAPDQTKNPYYIELGWKNMETDNSNIQLPNKDTIWQATSSILTPNSGVTLYWTNKDNIIF